MSAYSMFPYDQLVLRLHPLGIQVSDELFYTLLEYTECNCHMALSWTSVIEQLKSQGIETKDVHCGFAEGNFIALFFPKGHIYIARRNESS